MQNLQLREIQAEKADKEVQKLEQVETEAITERAAKKGLEGQFRQLGEVQAKKEEGETNKLQQLQNDFSTAK